MKKDDNAIGMFGLGFILTMVSLWFLFDSVRVSTGGHGLVSGMLYSQFRGGTFETASMGLIFVPFILGVIALVYSAAQRWAWILTWSGIGIIVVEMLSRVKFLMNMKSSYLLLVMALFAVGAGLMLRASYSGEKNDNKKD